MNKTYFRSKKSLRFGGIWIRYVIDFVTNSLIDNSEKTRA